MNVSMRTLILGAAIGVAAAVTTISPTQAGMIGPGKLQITEPTSLAEPVRGRPGGGGVSLGSTVRSGSGGVAQGPTRPWPGKGAFVDSRALNLKALNTQGGHYHGHRTGGGHWCHHGGCQK